MSRKVENDSQGPQIIRRITWQDVPEYDGFKIKVWRNPPQKLWQALVASGDDDETTQRRLDALWQIFPEHNGWRDYDGTPFPPANTREFWEMIPTELAVTLIALANEVQQQLPNSLTATRRR